MTCAAAAFFVLVTSRQRVFQNCLEILLNFICCPDVAKQTLELLVNINLARFYYLSINIVDQTCYSMGR